MPRRPPRTCEALKVLHLKSVARIVAGVVASKAGQVCDAAGTAGPTVPAAGWVNAALRGGRRSASPESSPRATAGGPAGSEPWPLGVVAPDPGGAVPLGGPASAVKNLADAS